MRAAVLTASPATMPSFVAPIVTATSPVITPARAAELVGFDLEPELVDRLDQIERRPNGALGVLLGGHRSAPHRHHGVADELLDHTAVAGDHRSGDVEVAGEQLTNLLRIADSDSGVKPTRSQNSTEHMRRSATGSSANGVVGAARQGSPAGRPTRRHSRHRSACRARRRHRRRGMRPAALLRSHRRSSCRRRCPPHTVRNAPLSPPRWLNI